MTVFSSCNINDSEPDSKRVSIAEVVSTKVFSLENHPQGKRIDFLIYPFNLSTFYREYRQVNKNKQETG